MLTPHQPPRLAPFGVMAVPTMPRPGTVRIAMEALGASPVDSVDSPVAWPKRAPKALRSAGSIDLGTKRDQTKDPNET